MLLLKRTSLENLSVPYIINIQSFARIVYVFLHSGVCIVQNSVKQLHSVLDIGYAVICKFLPVVHDSPVSCQYWCLWLITSFWIECPLLIVYEFFHSWLILLLFQSRQHVVCLHYDECTCSCLVVEVIHTDLQICRLLSHFFSVLEQQGVNELIVLLWEMVCCGCGWSDWCV